MQQGIFSGQQQQQQQQLNSVTQMANALVMPLVFGDSRDLTIKKFNQLQAHCGHGKGIVNHAQTIDFSQDNPYCRFKVFIVTLLHIYFISLTTTRIISSNIVRNLYLKWPEYNMFVQALQTEDKDV